MASNYLSLQSVARRWYKNYIKTPTLSLAFPSELCVFSHWRSPSPGEPLLCLWVTEEFHTSEGKRKSWKNHFGWFYFNCTLITIREGRGGTIKGPWTEIWGTPTFRALEEKKGNKLVRKTRRVCQGALGGRPTESFITGKPGYISTLVFLFKMIWKVILMTIKWFL